MDIEKYPPHIQKILQGMPEGFVPDPTSPIFDPVDDLKEVVPIKEHESEWIPKRCIKCRYFGRDDIPSTHIDLPTFLCKHPQTTANKGGMLLLMHDEIPPEDCAFVVAEEKYKDKPIKKWLARLWLRLVRPMKKIGKGGK